jgi:restriction system protein
LPELKVQRLEKLQASDGVYEIDVTARFEVLGARFLVLIECKNHKNPIKREVVQVLYDRIRAVGAHKGMIFSTAKFQKGAIEFARAHNIALLQIVEGCSPINTLSLSCISNDVILDSNLRRRNLPAYKLVSDEDVET